MAFNVNNFRSALQRDGARPNLFEVRLHAPSEAGGLGQDIAFFCKAAQIPGTTINSIDVPYFGRTIKVAGNRTYDNWTVTVINDEDFVIRGVFEKWHNWVLNTPIGNLRSPGARNTYDYAKDCVVKHYAKDGSPIKYYQLVGAWPTEVSAIDLAWDSNDTIEEYTVTFAYQYWTTEDIGFLEGEISGMFERIKGAVEPYIPPILR